MMRHPVLVPAVALAACLALTCLASPAVAQVASALLREGSPLPDEPTETVFSINNPAVNHAGVCDFQTQYASDVTHGRARSMGGEPWDDLKGMDSYNPMRHAAGFKTPMLVLHGTKDYRVPSDQALEIYGVYKAMKLDARLVVYPDENHWILKPRNSLNWYGEVLGWLERWIG